MNDRFFFLLSRYQRVDDELRDEQRRPLPDFARLQHLKRIKLHIKDRLARLMGNGRAFQ